MKNTTKIVLSSLVGVGMLAGVGTAHAQTATSTATSTPKQDTLITALAQRFNLSITDLKAFFADFRAKQEAQREQHRAEELQNKLSKAVTNGKLSQAQVDLINAEITKVRAELVALKGKSKDEQKAALKNIMETEKAWAKANNLPFGQLESVLKGMKVGEYIGKGKKMGARDGDWHKATSTSTTTPR